MSPREIYVIRITYIGGNVIEQKRHEKPPKFTLKSAQHEFGKSVTKLEVIRCEEMVEQSVEAYSV